MKIKYKTKLRVDGVRGILKSGLKVWAHESNVNIDRPHARKAKMKLIARHPVRVIKALTGKELNIGYADVVLTTVCTLRCKGCRALIDYNNQQRHYSLDKIITSLTNLLNAVDHINRIHVLGGEPLCYPQLYEVLSFLQKQKKINSVGITTNGTLLIKDERVLELLHDKKFHVDISYYGDEVSRKQAELIKQLEENHIRYRSNTKGDSWISFGGFDCRNKSASQLYKSFSYCPFKWCRPISDGKMFRCSRSAHGTKLDLIPLEKDEYVDLSRKDYPPKKLKKELFKFLHFPPKYLTCCNYCNMEPPLTHIEAGVQVPKQAV